MFRSHHITLMLADERRRDLTLLGATLHVSRQPEPQPERTIENRFVEPEKHGDASQARPLDPAPTQSPRRATIRVWRRGGELHPHVRPTATAAECAARELDRV